MPLRTAVVCAALLTFLGINIAYAGPSARDIVNAKRDEQSKFEEDAAARAYLRLGAWNLENRASRRASSEVDLATISEVIRKFYVLAIQDPGPEGNVDAIATLVSATSGNHWQFIRAQDNQADPVIMWDTSKVSFVKQRVFPAPDPTLCSSIVIAEMSWQGHPFYMANMQVYRPGSSLEHNGRAITEQFMGSVFGRFTRQMPPLFLALSSRGDTPPENMEFLNDWLSPILKTGDVTMIGGAARPDNILTNFRRPVRTGPYPYNQALIMTTRDAAARVSSHLPIIVLTSLAE